MSATIQCKRGKALALTILNPRPAAGELIIELDTGKFKIGDGRLNWNSLPYSNTVGAHTHAVSDVVGLQQILDSKQPAGSYVETVDARLSDPRTPTAHASTHSAGGSDPVSISASQVSGLATVATSGSYTDLSNKPSLFSGAYSDLTGAPSLAAVATSGSYNDLSDKPAPVSTDWPDITNKPSFATVAFSNDYRDLSNQPLIFDGSYDSLRDKPSPPSLAAVAYSGDYNDLYNKPSLASVAISGSYNDLSDKPAPVSTDWPDITNKPSFAAVAFSNDYRDLANQPTYNDLTGRPSLFSGDFNDLYNKPSIPTGPFFSGDYNDLINQPYIPAGPFFSGDYNDLSNKPTLFSGNYSDLISIPDAPYKFGANEGDGEFNSGIIPSYYPAHPGRPRTDVGTYSVVSGGIGNSATAEYSGILGGQNNTISTAYSTSFIIGSAITADASNTTFVNNLKLVGTGVSLTFADGSTQTKAFSGSYADLTGLPTLFDGAYSSLTGAPSLATVATSGSYNDLTDTPSLFSGSYNDLSDTPALFSGDYNDLSNKPTLFSGDYRDLANQPLIFDGSYLNLRDVPSPPSFATVASTGDYNDLTNKPYIPTGPFFSGDYNDLSNQPTLGTAAAAASTDFAAASHTHALSSLTQSGATSGQVVQWAGTAWVASDPSAVSVATYNDLPASSATSAVYLVRDTQRLYGSEPVASLLLHFDGTNGTTTFTDSSPSMLALTANGGAAISTDGFRYGNASGKFDGPGDYLIAPYSVADFGVQDFTVEGWVYLASKNCNFPTVFSNYAYFGSSALMLFAGAGADTKWVISYDGNFPGLQSATDVAYQQWTHFAVVRHTNTLTLYINGVNEGSVNVAGSNFSGNATNFYINAAGDSPNNTNCTGYIDEFRVIKGAAAYTANFTPPTSPFSSGTLSGTFFEITPKNHTHDWTDITGKPSFFSGAYADLTGKPTLFDGAYSSLTGRPTLGTAAAAASTDFAAASHTHALSSLTQSGASTGQAITWNGSAWVASTVSSGSTAWNDITGKPTLFDGAYSSLTGKPTLATVATSGSAADLSGTLSASRLPNTAVSAASYGSASSVATFTVDSTGRLTAAGSTTIAISSSAVSGLPAAGTGSTNYCVGNDSRLSDSREWSASTVTQADAEAGTATARVAWTVQRVWQAISAWWAASAAKTKLDGIAAGATANSSDATLLARANHTGTQAASTITGLATVATSGAYSDLTGKPTLGTAASAATSDFAAASHNHAASALTSGTIDVARLPVGTGSTQVAAGDDSRFSNSRSPTAHKSTHATGGSDALTASDIGAAASSHTHALSSLTQSSAATGQVPQWDGTAWVAATVSSGSSAWSDITGKPTFATVATSGSYNDLINKPSLFSGSYSDLTNKPSIPSAYSLPVATASVLGGVKQGSNVTISSDGTISVSAPVTTLAYSAITGTPSLATVATSGSYNDLSNKPSLFSGAYADLTGKPTLGTAAASATSDFATAVHTHALSSLTQSSATTGQVPQWSGTAWVPVTPASAASVADGSITTAKLASDVVIDCGSYSAVAPNAPTGLTATAGLVGVATLSWTAPTLPGGAAITDYSIQYSTDSGSSWTSWSHSASTATTATVTSLSSVSTIFRVAGINSVGTGSYSSSSTAMTPAASKLSISRTNGTSTFTGSGTPASPFARSTKVAYGAVDGMLYYRFTASASGTFYWSLLFADNGDNDGFYVKQNSTTKTNLLSTGSTASGSFAVSAGDVMTFTADNTIWDSFANVSIYMT